jgi:CheY-like chemotaxis protein
MARFRHNTNRKSQEFNLSAFQFDTKRLTVQFQLCYLSIVFMKPSSSSSSVPVAHILLVDDNQAGLAARKSVLEEFGYKVTTAVSGHEGLECFSRETFDLVITDYKMPRMNGIELIERVRKQNKEIPVILISGFAEPLGLNESNTGADVVIQKSSHEVTHMVRSVSRLLRRQVPKKPPTSQQMAAKAKRKSG